MSDAARNGPHDWVQVWMKDPGSIEDYDPLPRDRFCVLVEDIWRCAKSAGLERMAFSSMISDAQRIVAAYERALGNQWPPAPEPPEFPYGAMWGVGTRELKP